MKLFYILLAIIFSINGLIGLDPDLGWHLRIGQIISSSGVPLTDPFSYTMPSFHFIDHEWLTNVALWQIYSRFGLIPIALIFGVIGSLTMYVLSRSTSQTRLNLALVSLGSAVYLSFTGIRPQMITALFLALLVQVLFNQKLYLRFRWLIPLLFLIWVNLHGGFAAGLATFIVVIIVKSIRLKKVDLTDLTLVGLSILVTFINPYHEQIWVEIWRSGTDSSLRDVIQEWTPGIFSWNFLYILLITFSGAIIYKYRQHFRVEQIIIYVIFLVLSLSSVRHIPLWLMVSLPMILTGLGYFLKQLKTNHGATERFNKVWKVFTVICWLILIGQIGFDLNSAISLSENNYYPKQAVSYLINHPEPGQLFSSYNWGGYLIWKLPNQKVFIDGRMPSWKQSAPQNQSNNALADYLKMTSPPYPIQPQMDQYGIQTILWTSPDSDHQTSTSWLNNLRRFWTDLFPAKPVELSFNQSLVNQGWKVIYSDKIATIYQK